MHDDAGTDVPPPDLKLEDFYRRSLPVVRQFVARRVDDPHLAADLTADVFVAALQSAHSFDRGRGTERAWLLGIARNVVADEWTRRRREGTSLRRLVGQRSLDSESQSRIVERLDAERASRRLYQALASLSELDRAILEHVALDGQSIAETARELGLAPGTARVRLFRARRRVQEHMELMELSPSPISQTWRYAND